MRSDCPRRAWRKSFGRSAVDSSRRGWNGTQSNMSRPAGRAALRFPEGAQRYLPLMDVVCAAVSAHSRTRKHRRPASVRTAAIRAADMEDGRMRRTSGLNGSTAFSLIVRPAFKASGRFAGSQSSGRNIQHGEGCLTSPQIRSLHRGGCEEGSD